MVEEIKKQVTSVAELMAQASKRSGNQMTKAFSLIDTESDSSITFSKTYVFKGKEIPVKETLTLTASQKKELQDIFGITDKELIEAVEFSSSDRLDQLNGMKPIITSMRKAINPLTETFEDLPDAIKAKYQPSEE